MKREILIEYRGNRSQKEIAKQYGVPQQTWQRWEAGKNKPNVVTMKRLEDDIGVPMEVIFADVFN